MADKVTIEALESHTHAGKAYDAGDTYDVDAADADNLLVQGKAKVADLTRRVRVKALKSSKSGKLKPAAKGRKAKK